MRDKPRQIKFYCTEDQFQRLQNLKVLRHATTQELMNEALEDALAGLRRDEEAGFEMGLRRELQGGSVTSIVIPFEVRKGEETKLRVWQGCIRTLPSETIDAFGHLMLGCLRFFNSSRLKPQRPEDGEPVTDGEETKP
ncbi:MAG TPA: hypothetical protein DCY80_19980 [Solibacterales bacterium]|nr:hypothetical protein [Bryobacterales bacterium]